MIFRSPPYPIQCGSRLAPYEILSAKGFPFGPPLVYRFVRNRWKLPAVPKFLNWLRYGNRQMPSGFGALRRSLWWLADSLLVRARHRLRYRAKRGLNQRLH